MNDIIQKETQKQDKNFREVFAKVCGRKKYLELLMLRNEKWRAI